MEHRYQVGDGDGLAVASGAAERAELLGPIGVQLQGSHLKVIHALTMRL